MAALARVCFYFTRVRQRTIIVGMDVLNQDEIDRLLIPVSSEAAPSPVLQPEDMHLRRVRLYEPKAPEVLTPAQCAALSAVCADAVSRFHNTLSSYRLMAHVSIKRRAQVACVREDAFLCKSSGNPFLYAVELSGARCILSIDQPLVYGYLLGQPLSADEQSAPNPRLYIDAIDYELCEKKVVEPYLAALCAAFENAGCALENAGGVQYVRSLQGNAEAGAEISVALAYGSQTAFVRLFMPEAVARRLGKAVFGEHTLWQGKANAAVSIGGFHWQDGMHLQKDAVIVLDKPYSEPVDIVKDGCVCARGRIVTVDDFFGVQITDVL